MAQRGEWEGMRESQRWQVYLFIDPLRILSLFLSLSFSLTLVLWWLLEKNSYCHVMAHVELKLSSSQKVTVMRECGSHRCLHLSDLGSPDIGRGKRKWSQMIGGGTPNGSGVPFPSTEVNTKKEFLDKSRGRRTIAISLRAKDKRLRHERLWSLSSQH